MNSKEKNIALIFAGGSGTRMGNTDIPKQFLEYNNKPVIIYTIEHFETHDDIDSIVVVCIEGWIDKLWEYCEQFNIKKVVKIVEGGTSGHDSIWNGIQAISEIVLSNDEANVLIHDGVRPLINKSTIDNNLRDLRKYGTSITAIEAFETVAMTDEKFKLTKTVNRHDCTLLRAPQCFRFKDIYDAHLRAQEDKYFDAIDSATLMEHYKYELHVTIGPTHNLKITTPIDFSLFKTIKEEEMINEK